MEDNELPELPDPIDSYAVGGSEIGFIPADSGIVVYTPPVERESEAGLDLSQADSLDASYPVRGRVVAFGPYVPDEYRIGTEVLVKRYVGIQMEVEGDPNYWYFDLNDRQVMGRFIGSD